MVIPHSTPPAMDLDTGLGVSIPLSRPWHREPWLLFIITLPALAVIASFITLWIAVEWGDTLVSDDYYKQGLGINRDMARDLKATQAGITGEIRLTGQILTVRLSNNELVAHENTQPVLLLVHPFNAALDQRLLLVKIGDNLWQASTTELISEKIHWQISVETNTWRVLTYSTLTPGTAVQLGTTTAGAVS